jgi:DNA-binding NarL/FixJ family response regulator
MELSSDGYHCQSDPPPQDGWEPFTLELRIGRQTIGSIHLYQGTGALRLSATDLRLARWGARVLARGLIYSHRIGTDARRRAPHSVEATLARAPLTPREREVVKLLVMGCSTRQIAQRTNLTVATVHTYLKRIYPKLGVHSRVELVARMAGTKSA